jgi:hypothetical protein
LLAEGNCVVKGEKLNKVEGELTRTKGKFAKLQMDMQVTESEARAASLFETGRGDKGSSRNDPGS